MRVVVVDDDPLITMALKTILEADPEVEVCAEAVSYTHLDVYKRQLLGRLGFGLK